MPEGAKSGKPGRDGLVRRLTATELAKRLSDVLNRVHYRGETVVVERGGKPLCQLTPVSRSFDFRLSDLVALLDSAPAAGEEWAAAVAEGVAEQEDFEGFEWPR